jgi:hypothetical protein
MLARSKPEHSARLLQLGQQDIVKRWKFYEALAQVDRQLAAEAASRAASEGDGTEKAQAEEEEVKA